jgi:hypothetical protein
LKHSLTLDCNQLPKIRDPQAMQALMQDPDYRANIPRRDQLFDFDRNQMFAVSGMIPPT